MAIKKTKSQESAPAPVVTTPSSVTQNLPTTYDWSAVNVTGYENVGKEDLGVPFLAILQKGSPEIDRTHPEYATKHIDGSEAGDIINNISREVLYGVGDNEQLQFIPCAYERLYMEWKPRNAGGGMVRAHKDPNILTECRRNEKNQDVLRNGNIVVTTAYFYGLVITEEGRRPAVVGMSSTQLKKARGWLNTMMSLKCETPKGRITPPMFSHVYGLSTVPESNESGSWFGWKIACLHPVTDPVMIAEAIESAKMSVSGQRVALPPPSETPDSDAHVPFA